MNKKELQDALRETKKQLKRYQDAQVWYSGALTVLSPLRYHMAEILDMIDTYNSFAVKINELRPDQQIQVFKSKRLKNARKAAEKCENYFVKPIDNSSKDGIVPDTET